MNFDCRRGFFCLFVCFSYLGLMVGENPTEKMAYTHQTPSHQSLIQKPKFYIIMIIICISNKVEKKVNTGFSFMYIIKNRQTNNRPTHNTQHDTPTQLTSLTQDTSASTTGKTTYLDTRQDKTRQDIPIHSGIHSTHMRKKIISFGLQEFGTATYGVGRKKIRL